MKTLFVLLLGIAIGVGAYVYLKKPQNRDVVEQTEENISEGADKVRENLPKLDTEEIKAELERSGQVIRRKAEKAGSALKDATADARITAAIKRDLALDRDLSALRISVNTTDGIVTLAGSVSTPEEVKKAMEIALAIDGVREVASTLQVKQTKS